MIVPPVEVWTAGEEPDADTMKARAQDILEFLLEPPFAYAVQDTTVQSIPTASWTKISLDTTVKDNDGIVDLSTDRFTIQTPGWYEVTLGVGYQLVDATNDPKGRRIAAARLNGVTTAGGVRGRRDTIPDRGGSRSCRTGGSIYSAFLNTGDYLELLGYQDSTVSRNTIPAEANARAFLAVRWVSN